MYAEMQDAAIESTIPAGTTVKGKSSKVTNKQLIPLVGVEAGIEDLMRRPMMDCLAESAAHLYLGCL